MSLWLTNLPSWVVFILALCATNAIALASTLVARRWYGRRGAAIRLAARDLAPSRLAMLNAYVELGYPYCGSVSIGPEQITAALHGR